MQQADPYLLPSGEPITVVYMAESWTEAVVVRGLLESSGIPSPALGDGYPPDFIVLAAGIEIYALESHAARARQLISEYLADLELEPDPTEADESQN